MRNPAGVELSFLDGTSISAGVLIGADGYFSQVRQQLLQDGPPSFGVSNACVTAFQEGRVTVCPCVCTRLPKSALPVCLMLAPLAYLGHHAIRELSERALAPLLRGKTVLSLYPSHCAFPLPAGHCDLACAAPVVPRVCEPQAVVLFPVADRPGAGLSHCGGQCCVDHVSSRAGVAPPRLCCQSEGTHLPARLSERS